MRFELLENVKFRAGKLLRSRLFSEVILNVQSFDGWWSPHLFIMSSGAFAKHQVSYSKIPRIRDFRELFSGTSGEYRIIERVLWQGKFDFPTEDLIFPR